MITAISRTPKPSDGHSIASDHASNASGEVRAEVADGPRDAVAALAGGQAAVGPIQH